MGYKNEYASINQFSSMKQYFDNKIKKQLIPIIKQTAKKEKESDDTPVKYTYSPNPYNVPCIGFDGGLATLFPGEASETKLLKVSAGFDDQYKDILNNDYQDDIIHIFTGKLKWAEGLDLDIKDVIDELVDILLDNKTIKQALKILNISLKEFKSEIRYKIASFKGKGVEDNIREIFELCAIIVYNEKNKNNQHLIDLQNKDKTYIPFLIIKDGTLYPSSKTVTAFFAEKIKEYFSHKDNFIVGVVKSSRFVNKDNSWSNLVVRYAQKLPSHTYYRIPDKLELAIDPRSKELPYRRYFLTLFGGQSVFEIQISRTISDNKILLEKTLDVLISQVTIRYGGSIITNSFAHEKASLSEAEAITLTKEAKYEINKIINEDGE